MTGHGPPRATAALALAFAFLATPPAGLAVPVPKTHEEVAKESDFIGTVRVLAVACTGEAPFPDTEASSQTYQAWLQVVSVKKGAVKANQTLLVSWQDVPKTVMGPWKVEYFPGEEVETKLKWNAARKMYESTWHNAKGKASRVPDTKKLPVKAGEVAAAKGVAGPAKGD